MGNRIKRLLILNLWFFTVMYLAYVFKIASEEDWFVSRAASRYLQIECTGNKGVGASGETDWGEALEAVPGYQWYCLDFQMENKGSQPCLEIPESVLSFPEAHVRDWTYRGKEAKEESLYRPSEPYLPGETSVRGRIYVQVAEGRKEISAKYAPTPAHKQIELEIELEP